jgi:hypothetical protein
MNAATQFIEAVASNMSEMNASLLAIADVLCDGEALTHLGVTDEDQAMIEEAHDIITGWIDAGKATLSEATTV